MPKYLVEAISMFRMRYVVDAKCADYAKDVVVMKEDDLKEFSQLHLDEVISDAREITDEEYLVLFNKDNDYLKDWPEERKFNFVNIIS